MSRIAIRGWGAVCPGGWGAEALRDALERRKPLPTNPLPWPGSDRTLAVREVPPPTPRPTFLGHPRLRRASPITHYAAGALLEALERAGGFNASFPPTRLGLVMCMLAGCVHYSYRFFDEVLKDPVTASPLLFPETVFNAPASHVVALLGQPLVTSTLLGDAGAFLQGVALAAEWLQEGRVDGCLVAGAEETNWLLASALWYFDHGAVLGGGAGALYLERADLRPPVVELDLITIPQPYSSRRSRAETVAKMRQDLPAAEPGELLCDSRQGRPRVDAVETAAWQDWDSARLSPKMVLGEGLMASGAWQCVAACDALAHECFRAANISIVGGNQQAIGARFTRVVVPDGSSLPATDNR